LTIHSLRGIEPVTKEEILADQAEHPPMGRRLGVEPSEVEMVHTTGGTSGRGREIYGLTMRDVANVGMLSSFSYAWAGLRAGEAGAYNVGLSNSSGGNCWISATQAIGRAPVIIAHTGFDERIDLLRRFPPAAMYGTPSAINGLVNTAERRAINLREEIPSLRSIIVTGEPYPVEWARAMEELWGVQLFEAYGLTQSGSSLCAATCECGAAPEGLRGRMHLWEWAFVLEIVDPETLEPTPLGEEGEILLTTLDKEASPVVRFRTRDRVRYLGRDGCACGRVLRAVEAGSIARFDDMIKIKGQNVWPSDIEATLFGSGDVAEFNGVVAISDKGRDELTLSVAVRSGVDGEGLAQRLRRSVKEQFNLTPVVRIVDSSELETFDTPERKARRVKDVRQEGLRESARATGLDG